MNRPCPKCGSVTFTRSARGVVCELGHLQELPPERPADPAARPPDGAPEPPQEEASPAPLGAEVPPPSAPPKKTPWAPGPPPPPAVEHGFAIIRNAEVEGRVDTIAKLMADGHWTIKKSRELATTWGISEKTVRNYTGEASRRVYASGSLGDLAVRRVVAIGKTDMLFALAVQASRGWPGPDGIPTQKRDNKMIRTALAALELQARLEGLLLHEQSKTLPGAQAGSVLGTLPAELAALNPPPSVEELRHYVEVEADDDCNIVGCRIHRARTVLDVDPDG